jgi:hypothetical protein
MNIAIENQININDLIKKRNDQDNELFKNNTNKLNFENDTSINEEIKEILKNRELNYKNIDRNNILSFTNHENVKLENNIYLKIENKKIELNLEFQYDSYYPLWKLSESFINKRFSEKVRIPIELDFKENKNFNLPFDIIFCIESKNKNFETNYGRKSLMFLNYDKYDERFENLNMEQKTHFLKIELFKNHNILFNYNLKKKHLTLENIFFNFDKYKKNYDELFRNSD